MFSEATGENGEPVFGYSLTSRTKKEFDSVLRRAFSKVSNIFVIIILLLVMFLVKLRQNQYS